MNCSFCIYFDFTEDNKPYCILHNKIIEDTNKSCEDFELDEAYELPEEEEL
jgi:hypothetical protein